MKKRPPITLPWGWACRNGAFDVEGTAAALMALDLDDAVAPSTLTGGNSRARRLVEAFTRNKLAACPAMKNGPGLDGSSILSPYLRFRQISPPAILRA
ncbi:MAG: hypothetical protein PHP02_01435 [Eubacteriales bacterium]|nr:hypothetical protein [Eubacteriales bacterium]